MSTFWPVVVQWLHILAGIVWVGGYAFVALALWPALLRRPAPEARALYHALDAPAERVIRTAAQLTLLLGLVRGIAFGPIRSFDVLVGSAYGRTFAAAILLAVAAIAASIRVGQRLEARVWDGDAFRPGAARYVRRSMAVPLALLAAVVGCMVLMRFGL